MRRRIFARSENWPPLVRSPLCLDGRNRGESGSKRVGVEWRLEKAKTLAFLNELEVSYLVGAASPEFTRGEIVERGRRNSSSEMVVEPQTTKPFNGDVHVCALVE